MIAEAEIVRGAPIAGALRRQCEEAIEKANITPHLVNIVAGEVTRRVWDFDKSELVDR